MQQLHSWQTIQLDNFTCIENLISFLQLDDEKKRRVLKNHSFPLNLPRRLAEKIEKNSFTDPIFKQFVPIDDENIIDQTFSNDPVKDTDFQKEKRLLHKYKNRALLLTTSHCTMNCRFCFRKFFPYEKTYTPFEKELSYIQNNPELNEIILSGGDPLSLADPLLKKLLTNLDQIEHVKRIRFHTRFPLGIPERITPEFLEILNSLSSQVYFVLHTNHPNELDQDIFSALKKIHKTGAVLLSQTVFMKEINDDLNTLKSLFDLLSDNGVLPYYLHQLDPVQGSKHFFVGEEKGIELLKQLRNELSGYSLPNYVKEIPHKKSKTLIL